jgi:hypothetical protein
MGRLAARVLTIPIVGGALAWGAAAIAIDGPDSPLLARAAAVVFVFASLVCLFAIRPVWRGFAVFAGLFTALLVWWLSFAPSNQRDWLPDVARLPSAIFDGDRVTVRNVRSFD